MTSRIEDRLAELGFDLPAAPDAAASYLPCVRAGALLFVSGQLPLRAGALTATGQLGDTVDVADGREAARWCAINVLAQVKAALGELDRIERLVKITVFVSTAPGFTDQHVVANGASDFFVQVLGDAGTHSRSAVGVAALPVDAAVEVEAVIQTR